MSQGVTVKGKTTSGQNVEVHVDDNGDLFFNGTFVGTIDPTGLATDTGQDTTNTRLGGLTEAAPATDTASSGLNGRLQRIAQGLTSIIGLLPGSLGQKARAASLAVTLSTEDITTLTPPAAISGFATETTLSAMNGRVGSTTETAPATDTASSGLNGRLQRIAQRLTSLIALLPGSLGQKARASSLAVTLSTEDITALTPSGTTTVTGTVDENLKQVNGTTVNVNTGNAGAGTQRVVLATDQPTVDTNANVRIGGVAANAGSGAAGAGTQRVILASDQTSVPITGALTDAQLRATAVPVSGTVVTGGLTDTQLRATPVPVSKQKGSATTSANVSTSTTVATLLASNAARVKGTIYNDSLTGILLVKEGAAASPTSFDYALTPATTTTPGGTLICDDYTGILTGILTLGTGTARVGET